MQFVNTKKTPEDLVIDFLQGRKEALKELAISICKAEGKADWARIMQGQPKETYSGAKKIILVYDNIAFSLECLNDDVSMFRNEIYKRLKHAKDRHLVNLPEDSIRYPKGVTIYSNNTAYNFFIYISTLRFCERTDLFYVLDKMVDDKLRILKEKVEAAKRSVSPRAEGYTEQKQSEAKPKIIPTYYLPLKLLENVFHAYTEIHDKDVYHIDVKAENLFLCRDDNGNDIVSIGDLEDAAFWSDSLGHFLPGKFTFTVMPLAFMTFVNNNNKYTKDQLAFIDYYALTITYLAFFSTHNWCGTKYGGLHDYVLAFFVTGNSQGKANAPSDELDRRTKMIIRMLRDRVNITALRRDMPVMKPGFFRALVQFRFPPHMIRMLETYTQFDPMVLAEYRKIYPSRGPAPTLKTGDNLPSLFNKIDIKF